VSDFSPLACPVCGVSWVGEEISPDLRNHYGGLTHGRRSIGVYDMQRDMRVAIACRDCTPMFDRWTGLRLYALSNTKRPY